MDLTAPSRFNASPEDSFGTRWWVGGEVKGVHGEQPGYTTHATGSSNRKCGYGQVQKDQYEMTGTSNPKHSNSNTKAKKRSPAHQTLRPAPPRTPMRARDGDSSVRSTGAVYEGSPSYPTTPQSTISTPKDDNDNDDDSIGSDASMIAVLEGKSSWKRRSFSDNYGVARARTSAALFPMPFGLTSGRRDTPAGRTLSHNNPPARHATTATQPSLENDEVEFVGVLSFEEIFRQRVQVAQANGSFVDLTTSDDDNDDENGKQFDKKISFKMEKGAVDDKDQNECVNDEEKEVEPPPKRQRMSCKECGGTTDKDGKCKRQCTTGTAVKSQSPTPSTANPPTTTPVRMITCVDCRQTYPFGSFSSITASRCTDCYQKNQ